MHGKQRSSVIFSFMANKLDISSTHVIVGAVEIDMG